MGLLLISNSDCSYVQEWTWPLTAASQFNTDIQRDYKQRAVGVSGHTEPLFWSLHLWPGLHILRQSMYQWKHPEEIC